MAIIRRPAAAGIVPGHPAYGGTRRGRDIDREPQAVRFELAVEIVEDDARLDNAATARRVQFDDGLEVL